MKIRILILLGILFILASIDLAAAEKIMYKWTDKNGEIHYTERVPKGIEYTIIRSQVDSRNANSTKSPTTPINQTKPEEKKDSYRTWRDENCTLANQNLDILKTASRIGVDDGQGGKRLMTDEEKKEKIAKMEEQRDKYCNASEDKE